MTFVAEWIRNVMTTGGWVMLPLLVLSLASVMMTVERALFWLSGRGGRRPGWLSGLASIGGSETRDQHAAIARLAGGDSSVYGQFAARLVELGRLHGHSGAAFGDAVERVRPRVERFSVSLSTIITAAPMLGILGTVTGIIRSFRLLGAGEQVVVDPTQVAGGIGEALITTAFGLGIALLTLFPYQLFRAATDRCFSRLELIADVAGVEGSEPVPAASDPGS